MKRTLILFAVVLIFVAGCTKSAPTIDASSSEAFKASLDRVEKSLPVEKQAKFRAAVMLITISGISASEVTSKDGATHSIERMKKRLDGKTGEEIIAEGEKIKNQYGSQ